MNYGTPFKVLLNSGLNIIIPKTKIVSFGQSCLKSNEPRKAWRVISTYLLERSQSDRDTANEVSGNKVSFGGVDRLVLELVEYFRSAP